MNTKTSNIYPFHVFSKFIVQELPNYNQQGKFTTAINYMKDLLPSTEEVVHIVEQSSFEKKVLALGDLGMSLVTYNLGKKIPPVELTTSLQMLASATSLVPRDSFPTYMTYNPIEALRTYSGDESEKHFILHTKRSQAALQFIIKSLLYLQKNPFIPNRLDILKATGTSIQMVKKESASVHKDVNPEFFFRMFRRYFFPIEVKSVSYSSPSAVHLPELMLIDTITGYADATRVKMIYDFLPYIEPKYKVAIKSSLQKSSLKELYHSKEHRSHCQAEIEMLNHIFENLIHFRLAHQGLVTRYIRKQDSSVTLGTGGFPFDSFLGDLITMGEKAKI
ncbi:monodechloroaminopyrrolnitrin synthase PrnB family protein [Bacillus toyonensis]|uniref:Uncharacterized protein n=1 Tax=Bacillus toyonensis TaxID=155322 RepID=A0A2A8H1E9_9BACI|nr:monodechloroaminopyrrolnitrin synthase PrnB family protein [Bacillus toyonensis]PEP86144.1 hypothetical protein CN585_30350 [Bacillus toyonensis]